MKKNRNFFFYLNLLITIGLSASLKAAPNSCDVAQAALLRRMNEAVSLLVVRRAELIASYSKYASRASIANCLYTSGSETDDYFQWRENHAKKVSNRVMAYATALPWEHKKRREIDALVSTCQSACTKPMGKYMADYYCKSMRSSIDKIMETYPSEFEGCDLASN